MSFLPQSDWDAINEKLGYKEPEKPIIAKIRITVAIIIGLTVLLLLIFTNFIENAVVQANHGGNTAPSLNVRETKCFQSINDPDDLYCAMRYTLPFKVTPDPIPITTPEAWCLELHDLAGCTDIPALPLFPKSLEPNHVFINFYENCTSLGDCSSADILSSVSVPRIGDSFGGIYLSPGHGVTFGNLTVFGCVESSTLLFTTPSEDCQQVVWASSSNTISAQRDELGDFFIQQLLALEIIQTLGLNFYVQNNLISDEGKTLVIEALNIADRILGEFFRASSTDSAAIEYATPSVDTPLQIEIAATATAIAGIWSGFGDQIGGGATAGGWFVTLTLGIIGYLFAYTQTKEQIFPVLVLSSIMWVGVSLNAIPFSVAAVYSLIMGTLAIVYGMRKLGTT